MVEKSSKGIVVKFEDLNFKLKKIITGEMNDNFDENIQFRRKILNLHNGIFGGFVFSSLYNSRASSLVIYTPVAQLLRQRHVLAVQRLHRKLLDEMNTYGIVPTSQEVDYEKKFGVDRLTPATIGKKHPIFYVNLDGDLVFLPESRMEYAQYKFQQLKIAKLGINPWWWRMYLRPPKAPESVKNWASNKANQWAREIQAKMGRLKSPVPQPVHAYARSTSNRPATSTPRRRLPFK